MQLIKCLNWQAHENKKHIFSKNIEIFWPEQVKAYFQWRLMHNNNYSADTSGKKTTTTKKT